MISSWKSSIAGYSTSSTIGERRWISSTNSTSPASRLVSKAARSPGRSRTGPEVLLIDTPISSAMMFARVVLPNPGGPKIRVWSSASWRPFAARMNRSICSRTPAGQCTPRASGANGAIQLLVAIATAGRDDTIRFDHGLHHALEGAANHLFTAQILFLYGGHCPAGLLGLEAQGNQSADRIILGACDCRLLPGSTTRVAMAGMLSHALKRSFSSTSSRSAVFLPTPGMRTSTEVSCA